jgi:CRP-like cAMP-binding protein
MNSNVNIDELKRTTIDTIAATLYPGMSLECKRILYKTFQPRRLSKNERVVNEGEVANSMIFIGRGMLRQFYYKNKRDVTEHFAYEGQGMMCIESFINRTPTSLMIEALEPSIIFEFMHDDMMRLIDDSKEINSFYRRSLEVSLIISQRKADSWRFESAMSRYQRLLSNHPEIVKRAPMIQIASYLLMTPETLSRIRSEI